MNHKHKKPRKSRAGCHLCKPWKAAGNSTKYQKRQEWRAELTARPNIMYSDYWL